MPQTGKALLDTNIIIALLHGEAPIKERIEDFKEVFISSVALGELLYGALKSGRSEANIRLIETFADACRILPCNAQTAREYGKIKFELKVMGRPIPENDLWIAAIARQHKLLLLTDDKHFGHIGSLRTENPRRN